MRKQWFVAMAALAAVTVSLQELRADLRTRAAREAAEFLAARFGAKVVKSVPALARQIEGLAARHGDMAIAAIRKGGPEAIHLVEAAGSNGGKALTVLMAHGEMGAARVLSRPVAMSQFLQFGDQAASVLVRHPGVAEGLVEKGGLQAVKALDVLTARSGRRLAILLEEDLAKVGRHAELLEVVAKHGGDKVTNFIWQNRGTLAGGAAMTAFLLNPEPYLNGLKDLGQMAGDTVVKPAINGVFTIFYLGICLLGLLIVAVTILVHKHGPPRAEQIKGMKELFKR